MRIAILALIFALVLVASLPAVAAKPPQIDLCDLLKDSPAYTELSAYSDYASDISLVADNPTGIGGILLNIYGRFPNLLRKPALVDAIITTDKEESLAVDTPASYPHGIISTGRAGEVEAEWYTTFLDTNLVLCELRLTNKGQKEVNVTPRLRGEAGEAPNVTVTAAFDAQRNTIVLASKEVPSQDKFTITHVVINPSFLVRDCRLGDSPATQEQHWSASGSNVIYSMVGGAFALPAGQSARLWVLLAVNTADRDKAIDAVESRSAKLVSIADLERVNRGRVNARLRQLPERAMTPEEQKLYYRSAAALIRNIGSPGGKFGANRPCFERRSRAVVTPLAASVQAIALVEIDPAIASEQFQILFDNQLTNGALPEWIAKDSSASTPSTQPPLAAWAAWRVYGVTRDVKFLKKVYEPLCRYTEWWFAEHDRDFDGICELVGVNDPTPVDQIYDSVELGGYMLAQLKALARMARILERDGQRASWETRAEQLGQRIMSSLYDPSGNVFYDALVTTRQRKESLTLGCFLPFWAGAPMTESREKAMARKYLGNPKYFLSDLPFSEFPLTDERYAAGCRISPLMTGLMIDGLCAVRGASKKSRGYSYSNEAKVARDRFLRMIAASGGLYEAYDARTGIGLDAPESGITAAVCIQTLLGRQDVTLTEPISWR